MDHRWDEEGRQMAARLPSPSRASDLIHIRPWAIDASAVAL
jgi:hypothetical protein